MTEQEVQTNLETTQDAQTENNINNDDILANLKISEDARKQLQSNEELLTALTHNIQTKRSANEEAKRYREELERIKKESEEAEKAKLKEQGEYKKLFEKTQAEIAERDAKLREVTIKNKVSILATQKGLKKESYLNLFNTANLQLDENMQVQGLEEQFNQFYNDNPDLFNSNTPQVNTDSGQPNVTTNNYTATELDKLEKAALKGNTRDIARLREYKREKGLFKQ
jgi:ribonuclease D